MIYYTRIKTIINVVLIPNNCIDKKFSKETASHIEIELKKRKIPFGRKIIFE